MTNYPVYLILILLQFILMGCGSTQESNGEGGEALPEGLLEEIRRAVDRDEISQTLQFLSSDELQGRMTGSEGIENAAAYIEGVFQNNGIIPYFETYRHSFEIEGLTGKNLVGFLEGSDPQLKDEIIIIGAHYDHIGSGEEVNGDAIANGANDNASGTTAVLELAKFLSGKDLKRSVIFALFSAEEMGLVGSRELAETLKQKGIELYVMFNIEMVGVPMTGKDYLLYVTGYERSNIAEKFNDYAGKEVLGFLPQAAEYNLFRRSDNYPFFEAFQVPSHTVSSFDFTNYDFYHHVDDEFEEMDTAHLEQVIESLIPGILGMANTETKEIALK